MSSIGAASSTSTTILTHSSRHVSGSAAGATAIVVGLVGAFVLAVLPRSDARAYYLRARAALIKELQTSRKATAAGFALVTALGGSVLTWKLSGRGAGRLVSYPGLLATLLWFIAVLVGVAIFDGFRIPVLLDNDRQSEEAAAANALAQSRAETAAATERLEQLKIAVREGLILHEFHASRAFHDNGQNMTLMLSFAFKNICELPLILSFRFVDVAIGDARLPVTVLRDVPANVSPGDTTPYSAEATVLRHEGSLWGSAEFEIRYKAPRQGERFRLRTRIEWTSDPKPNPPPDYVPGFRFTLNDREQIGDEP